MGEIFRTGVDINYNYVMFESEYKNIDFKQRFSGHSVSPVFSFILNFPKIKWMNYFSYAWAELKNEKESKEKTGTNNFSMRTLVFLDFYPFKAFSGFNWISKSPYYEYEGFGKLKMKYGDIGFSGGLGLDMKPYKIGVEFYYDLQDYKISDTKIKGSYMDIRFGNEVEVVKNTFLRAGIKYEYFDQNKELDDDEIKVLSISGGTGLNLIENLRIDITFIYSRRNIQSLSGTNLQGVICARYNFSSL